jgi:hypothetical protein
MERSKNQGPCTRLIDPGAQLIATLAVLSAIGTRAQARDLEADPANLDQMLGALAPGDVLHLAAGSYGHFTLADLAGSEAMPIVITGPDDGGAVIRADDGPCCNTIQIDGNVSHVVLRNLTIDGHGVDGAFGVDARGPNVHHVTIERCTFLGHDAQQQTVAISTKTPTAGWLIRANRISGAGTGMYLGNSNGEAPFVQGVIEHNLIEDTIGYNVEIKWQLPRAPVPGAKTGAGATIIRHNVFIKTDRPSDDGDRPNLLVGGYPESGEGSQDSYQIYGNLFVHNPREALLQASGRVSIHDNVFVDTTVAAIRLQDHDLPLERAWVYNNTIYADGAGISFGSTAREASIVVGNAVFAGTAISGPAGDARDNVTGTPSDAMAHVTAPSNALAGADFHPLPGALRGTALDLSAFAGDIDRDLDFDCRPKGALVHRGAYAGDGSNPGWQLAADIKPQDACANATSGTDGGVSGSDGGGGSTGDAGVSRADGGAIPPPAGRGGASGAGGAGALRDAGSSGRDAGSGAEGAAAGSAAGDGCGCRLAARAPSAASAALGLSWLAALAQRIRRRRALRPRS